MRVVDVTERQMSLSAVPHGAFGEDATSGDFLNRYVFVDEVEEALVEHYDCHDRCPVPGAGRENELGVEAPLFYARATDKGRA
jgi:hypothetical protein